MASYLYWYDKNIWKIIMCIKFFVIIIFSQRKKYHLLKENESFLIKSYAILKNHKSVPKSKNFNLPKFENTLWAWILCVVIIRAYSYSCYFWRRVYFVWCIVPRESVLQDSSAHKATCTVQNRHILNSCTDIQTFEPNTMITTPSIQVLCNEFCILPQSLCKESW